MLHEHHLTVPRTARYYTLGEPGPPAREIWIACHGYGQLAADFNGRMGALESADRLVVAPEGLSRFYHERARGGSHATSPIGASWMTREDRAAEIADQVAYLDALVDAVTARVSPTTPRLAALGFSQGVATVCRWLVHSRVRVDRLVAWGSAIPDDVLGGNLSVFRNTRIFLVAGSRDEFATPERVSDALTAIHAAGLDVTRLTFNGGHRLDDATLAQLVERGTTPDH
jgi:predicted esterase